MCEFLEMVVFEDATYMTPICFGPLIFSQILNVHALGSQNMLKYRGQKVKLTLNAYLKKCKESVSEGENKTLVREKNTMKVAYFRFEL